MAKPRNTVTSSTSKLLDWESRLAVWILYLVAVSLSAVLLLSWSDEETVATTWEDTWRPERWSQGWTWCLCACAISTLTVFITGEEVVKKTYCMCMGDLLTIY